MSPDEAAKLLGLPEAYGPQHLREAYHKAVMRFHPDLHPPERKEWAHDELVQRILAYQTLLGSSIGVCMYYDGTTIDVRMKSTKKPAQWTDSGELIF